MTSPLKINIVKLTNTAIVPTYATAGSAGVDLYSDTPDFDLAPGEIFRVHTGVAMEIPHGYEGQVRSRSGLASLGVIVLNSPGTIDSDYRGEVCVLLANVAYAPVTISQGSRVAQMVVAPVAHIQFNLAAGITGTSRGSGGFGSTGA